MHASPVTTTFESPATSTLAEVTPISSPYASPLVSPQPGTSPRSSTAGNPFVQQTPLLVGPSVVSGGEVPPVVLGSSVKLTKSGADYAPISA